MGTTGQLQVRWVEQTLNLSNLCPRNRRVGVDFSHVRRGVSLYPHTDKEEAGGAKRREMEPKHLTMPTVEMRNNGP